VNYILVESRGCQDGNSALIEAVLILSGGDVQVDSEEKLRASGVEVYGQGQLALASQPRVRVGTTATQPANDWKNNISLD